MKSKTTNEVVAKEGYKLLFILSFVLLFFYFVECSFISFIVFIFILLSIYIFRNPERVVEELDEHQIIAPIDGKILSIESNDSSLSIIIENFILDTHLIRVPFNSKIINKKSVCGACLKYSSSKSSILNENLQLELKSDDKNININILATSFANRIYFYHNNNDELGKSQRMGFLLSGIIELELPKNIQLHCDIGDSVKSGETILGYFKYE
ncbi:MAG: hypothetical protein HXX81_08220 [Campylobacterales bacterium]|nr:hypothetical protein [Campylobacterales bacterium]